MATVDLKVPVEHGGATYSKLTLRRANIGDLVAQERVDGDLAKVVVTLARLANIPQEVVEQIDVEDMPELSRHLAELMGKPEAAAGSTPSP